MRAILTYHSIDASSSPISISPEAFTRHVEWLASGRVRVTTVDDLLRLPDSSDAVAITFDDGYRNVGEIAAPLLARYDLPATVFVVADHVGRTNAWGGSGDRGIPTLPLLDWPDLARLAGQGLTIGAHTRTHRPLDTLTGVDLAVEVLGGARVIEERTGRAPTGFAYPYGRVSNEAASLVGTTYAWGCTTELRVLSESDDPTRLPRLDMYYFRQPGRLGTWGTARFNYYVKIRSHARRIRQRLTSGVAAL